MNAKYGSATCALMAALFAAGWLASDTIELRNGDILEGKIVKETEQLIKIRVPRRGKIVTTFLDRGNIESITKIPDEFNRKAFKEAGVRNPDRSFEPTYYGTGSVRSSAGGTTRGASRAGPARSRAPDKTAARKRGIEGRRDKFKSGLDRFGEKTNETKEEKPARPSSTSPSTTGSLESTLGASSFGR